MAGNLVASIYNDYTSMYAAQLDKAEHRPSQYGAMDAIKADSIPGRSVITQQDLDQYKMAYGVPKQIPILQKTNPVVSNARSCAFQTEGSTSALVTLTTVEIVTGFVASPQQAKNNYVGYQQYVAKQLDERFRKMAATVDQAAVDFLQTNTNSYFPAEILDFYPQVGNVLQVPQAEKNDFYNNLSSIYGTMDYDQDDIKVVSNFTNQALVNRFMNQGANNSTNEMFQFAPYDFYNTKRLANGVGEESRVLSFASNNTFMLDRLAPVFDGGGYRLTDAEYWEVLNNVPYLNGNVGVHYQAKCDDVTAAEAGGLAGLTADVYESWELSYEYSFISSYISDDLTDYRPILESAILS